MPEPKPWPEQELRDVLEQVLAFEDLNSALRYLCYGMGDLFPCDAAGILVPEAGSSTLIVNLAKSVAPQFVSLMTHEILARYQSYAGGEVPGGTPYTEVHGAPSEASFSSVVGDSIHTVLRDGNNVFGLLVLCATAHGAFSDEDNDRLQWSNGWIALALRALMRIRHASSHDALTGLYNRRRIEDEVEQALAQARRYDHSVGLVLADIDAFKQINDTHGHLIGDQVLREMADLLKKTARMSDIVGRLSGDEFVVLLPRAQVTAAAHFAERFRKAVRQKVFCEEAGGLRVTVSLGVSDSVIAGLETFGTNLFHTADEALYASKQAGRNTVTCADILHKK